jgi:hypothetical protein
MVKAFDGAARSPESQFQIGDRVTYLPEGVYTEISGYLWHNSVGEIPRIMGYELSCGIVAQENTIAHCVGTPSQYVRATERGLAPPPPADVDERRGG